MSIYYVTIRGKQYTVEIADPHARPVRAIVDGEVIEVNVAPAPVVTAPPPIVTPAPVVAAPQPVSAPPAVAAPDETLEEVKAPLPGTVVSINVTTGDAVQRGHELCVLEAMKMNNPIRANRAGVIRKIVVTVGQQVQHNDCLMLIGD
ncbi:MAG TPA: acetyl-CoA carboxylase biotin carboxyl carrier protein subunit [Anaerolineae bacterium]|nr:acetyl-CoA carboxylase biotin carboxyl carrier protein subunit [Anaerolineae bacterium]HQI85764.1 acetyl-CoA carboxylase biotin carboxyl carrier protein subunit [Anaerolineae bacterium]